MTFLTHSSLADCVPDIWGVCQCKVAVDYAIVDGVIVNITPVVCHTSDMSHKCKILQQLWKEQAAWNITINNKYDISKWLEAASLFSIGVKGGFEYNLYLLLILTNILLDFGSITIGNKMVLFSLMQLCLKTQCNENNVLSKHCAKNVSWTRKH